MYIYIMHAQYVYIFICHLNLQGFTVSDYQIWHLAQMFIHIYIFWQRCFQYDVLLI